MTELGAKAGSKEARFERLVADASSLSLKDQLRLVERLKAGAVLDAPDGAFRLYAESPSEYKRARRSAAGNPEMASWISSFARGEVFYDIGANTGAISLIAAHLHAGTVPVVAFEPAFDSFGSLVRNVALNGWAGTITALPVALSNRTAIMPFHRASLGSGTSLHAVGDPLDYTRRPFTAVAVEHVMAFRLDDLRRLYALPSPTRIKIDVDGFEDRVLEGAVETLTQGACEVCCEFVDAGPEDPHSGKVIESLATLGYEVRSIVPHGAGDVFPRIFDALFVRTSRP